MVASRQLLSALQELQDICQMEDRWQSQQESIARNLAPSTLMAHPLWLMLHLK